MGSETAAVERVFKSGNLLAMRVEADVMAKHGEKVPLDLAIGAVIAILDKEPERYERAAAKWLGRLASERPVTREQVGQAVDALDPYEFRRDVLERLARA